jgi:hypothetical protein
LRSYVRTNAAGVDETKWRIEIDDAIIRGKLRVFEFVISQLRGENDNVIFAGMMKVERYDESTKTLWLQTDEGVLYNPFREGDILMVQRFGGTPSAGNSYNVIKQYELRVTEACVGNPALGKDRLDYIRFSHFVGEIEDVAEGDVLTRVDSVSDSTRKGVVKITTIDEIGAPYLDVLYGMKTDPAHATKARMGNLAGIRTKNNADLTGQWGLYAEGAVLENAQIYLNNGMTVEQTFVVMEGNFLSQIDATKQDMSEEAGNILRNGSFGSNTYYWEAVSDVSVIKAGNRLLWLNKAYYADKKKIADIYRDGQRSVLRLKNTRITQPNAYLRFGEEYEKEGIYSFSFLYRTKTGGVLKAGVPGSDLYAEFAVTPSDTYTKYVFSEEWDGVGDFIFETNGEVLIYSVSLFNDALANSVIKLQTQITQNAQEIALRATKSYVDAQDGSIKQHFESELSVTADQIALRATKQYVDSQDGSTNQYFEGKLSVTAQQIASTVTAISNINNTIQTAGWITSADSISLFVSKTDYTGNNIISKINLTSDTTTIAASKIDLVGKVTFSMLDASAQNTINAKANTSSLKSLAFQDKVNKSMLDSTIISGGYIEASLINVADLVVNNALSVGVFTANGYGLIGQNGSLALQLYPSYVYGTTPYGYGELAFSTAMLQLTKTVGTSNVHTSTRFIEGIYRPSANERREIAIEILQGSLDDSWYKRTSIRLSHMPFYNGMGNLPTVANYTNTNTYNVKWDARTGYLFAE